MLASAGFQGAEKYFTRKHEDQTSAVEHARMNEITKQKRRNKIMKATRATVSIGHLSVDGYRMEDGKFGMSLADLARICGIEVKQATTRILKNKKVQALAGRGFETTCNVHCDRLRLTIISIDWVPAVLQCLMASGNEQAEDFLLGLAGLSLQQLFCDAFGEKFELAERQAWLQARFEGIEKRNSWTDSIKAYGETHEVSDNWKRFIYCNVSDRLNIALTGFKSKHWCDKFECTSTTLRDHWKPSHLSNIDAIERHATVLCVKGLEPIDALNQAIEFFSLPVNPEPQSTVSKEALRMRRMRGSALPLVE